MTSVEFRFGVDCGAERVKELLLHPPFLHAFVEAEGAVEKAITVNRDQGTSTLTWSIRLDGDLPGLVTQFIGRTAELHLVFDLANSTLDLTARAKRNATLICEFRIEPGVDIRSVLHLVGDLKVNGMLGGLAEGVARDQIVKKVFEDLVRLLHEWRVSDIGERDDIEA